MSNGTNRRGFLGYSFAAVAAVGGASALVGMKQAWDPLPSVLAAGFTTIDLAKANLVPGVPKTFKWRGKPIFILERTPAMIEAAKKAGEDGWDLVTGDKHYVVVIGICTHLGCIPGWEAGKGIWKCACHGGEYDASGKQTFGPPPKPFDVPPFKLEGTVLTLGETSAQAKAIMKARA